MNSTKAVGFGISLPGNGSKERIQPVLGLESNIKYSIFKLYVTSNNLEEDDLGYQHTVTVETNKLIPNNHSLQVEIEPNNTILHSRVGNKYLFDTDFLFNVRYVIKANLLDSDGVVVSTLKINYINRNPSDCANAGQRLAIDLLYDGEYPVVFKINDNYLKCEPFNLNSEGKINYELFEYGISYVRGLGFTNHNPFTVKFEMITLVSEHKVFEFNYDYDFNINKSIKLYRQTGSIPETINLDNIEESMTYEIIIGSELPIEQDIAKVSVCLLPSESCDDCYNYTTAYELGSEESRQYSVTINGKVFTSALTTDAIGFDELLDPVTGDMVSLMAGGQYPYLDIDPEGAQVTIRNNTFSCLTLAIDSPIEEEILLPVRLCPKSRELAG